MTEESWARSLLLALGIQPNAENVPAVVGWMRAEGGHWHNTAHFNPLNTTLSMPGATSMNSVGVKAYGSWEQGLDATVKTLRNGLYDGILKALSSGTKMDVANAIGNSPWGTNASLARSTIASASGGSAGGSLVSPGVGASGTVNADGGGSGFGDDLRRDAARVLLTAIFVLAGIGLAVFGTSRATGLRKGARA